MIEYQPSNPLLYMDAAEVTVAGSGARNRIVVGSFTDRHLAHDMALAAWIVMENPPDLPAASALAKMRLCPAGSAPRTSVETCRFRSDSTVRD
jgi:hypothetical protein